MRHLIDSNVYMKNKKTVAFLCDLIDEESKTGIWNYETSFVEILTSLKSLPFTPLFIHSTENDLTKNFDNLLPPKFIRNLRWKAHFIAYRLYRYLFLPILVSLKGVRILHDMNYASVVFPDWWWWHRRVVTLYDFIPLKSIEFAPWLERQLAYFGLNYSLKRADRIISISNFTKSESSQYWIDNSKISVSWIWPVKKDFSLKVPNIADRLTPGKYVLGVSSLAPHKNFKWILEAFVLAKSSMDLDWYSLVLVGKNRFSHESLISKYQDRDDIIFSGFVSDSELNWLYKNASCFVFPSFVEGFWLPVLEAMQFDCPVICSNRSSLPEVVWDSALLTDPSDTKEIANSIRLIANDSALRKTLVERGRERVKMFDMRRHVEDAIKIYSEIL